MARRVLIALATLTLVATACGGDDDTSSTEAPDPATQAPAPTNPPATDPPETDPPETDPPPEDPPHADTEPPSTEPPTTDPPAPGPDDRPAASVTAVLDITYPAGFDPAIMGFAAGQVTAEWYSADGRFAVVYSGLDLNESGPLCPGASIELSPGNWQFVANAPTAGADCPLDLFPTIGVHPGVEAYECDGVLTFHTNVPADQSGTLYGTLEIAHNNTWMGATSTADNSAGEFPELDLTLMSC